MALSSAAAAATPVAAPPSAAVASGDSLRVVQLDALVAVKILKHCRDALPALAMGQLLGLDVGARLEVTNCFAVPSGKEEDGPGQHGGGGGAAAAAAAASAEAAAEYQAEMMRCLRDVNVDNNAVGWYQSTYLGSFIGSGMLESQFGYQTNIAKSVVIVYGTEKREGQGKETKGGHGAREEGRGAGRGAERRRAGCHITAVPFAEAVRAPRFSPPVRVP